MEFEKRRAIFASVGDVLPWAARVARLCGWYACVGGMLLLLLSLLLFKYYLKDKNVECLLLKQKRKNVPNRSEQLFERRT